MASLHDTVAVKGMAAVGAQLEKLPIDMRDKVARKAVLEAAKVGLASVQQETPIRTGNLFHHERIAFRKNVPYNIVQYVVFVKTGGKQAALRVGQPLPYYWYFIEFGWHDRSGAYHPGNPFMLRGFEQSAGNAATRARDIAAYWVQRSIGTGKS